MYVVQGLVSMVIYEGSYHELGIEFHHVNSHILRGPYMSRIRLAIISNCLLLVFVLLDFSFKHILVSIE